MGFSLNIAIYADKQSLHDNKYVIVQMRNVIQFKKKLTLSGTYIFVSHNDVILKWIA